MGRFTLMHADREVLRFSYNEPSSQITSIDQVLDLEHVPLFLWNDRIAHVRGYDMVAK